MTGEGVIGYEETDSSEELWSEDSGIGVSTLDDLLNTKQKNLSNSSHLKIILK